MFSVYTSVIYLILPISWPPIRCIGFYYLSTILCAGPSSGLVVLCAWSLAGPSSGPVALCALSLASHSSGPVVLCAWSLASHSSGPVALCVWSPLRSFPTKVDDNVRHGIL